jgi:hypothetical protein
VLLGSGVELRHSSYDAEEAAEVIRRKRSPQAEDFASHALSPPPAEAAAELFTGAG